ncbi:MAG: 50S ribosomal protein L9 [Candidatus Omnitrophica bacterium]|nr:50S ribosomal protein L9 [Candidatus Omnitrophota bacterium]
MDVILMQDVPSLGAQGAVVTVKPGYARNYLLPQGLAQPATPANTRAIEALKRKQAAQAAAAQAAAQQMADRLATLSCTIPASVGEQEKLHGSVTTADIAEALQGQGIAVEKRQLVLEAPITQLGVYKVPVKLHPQVTATVKVWIVKA